MFKDIYTFFYHLLCMGIYTVGIVYLYRKVMQNKELIKSYIPQIPLLLRERLISANVLAGFYLSLIMSFLTVLVYCLFPQGFAAILTSQKSLLQSYSALLINMMSMVQTNKVTPHALMETILATPFTLQNIINFCYANRLILLAVFIFWLVNKLFNIYVYLIDAKKEKITRPENILMFSIFYYGALFCGLFVQQTSLHLNIWHMVQIETIIFWCILFITGAKFGYLYPKFLYR